MLQGIRRGLLFQALAGYKTHQLVGSACNGFLVNAQSYAAAAVTMLVLTSSA